MSWLSIRCCRPIKCKFYMNVWKVFGKIIKNYKLVQYSTLINLNNILFIKLYVVLDFWTLWLIVWMCLFLFHSNSIPLAHSSAHTLELRDKHGWGYSAVQPNFVYSVIYWQYRQDPSRGKKFTLKSFSYYVRYLKCIIFVMNILFQTLPHQPRVVKVVSRVGGKIKPKLFLI